MKQQYHEEFVKVNGIEHFMLHYPSTPEAPVLLYIHGGPGMSESFFAYMLANAWGDSFSHIYWDQRGAGKTLHKNKKAEHPQSIGQMVADMHGIIEYLKKIYKKDKIIILGHSWGTLISSLYIQTHPENVSAYIASGQVINMMENERVGFEQAMQLAKEAQNQKHVKQLEQIGEYPPSDPETLIKLSQKVRKIQECYEKAPDNGSLYMQAFRSPTFQLSDLSSLIKAMKVNRKLQLEMISFNLYAYPNSYKVPVHYILGEVDTTTPTSISSAYFDTIEAPYKTITIIPEASHNPMYEQTEQYADILCNIIQNLSAQ